MINIILKNLIKIKIFSSNYSDSYFWRFINDRVPHKTKKFPCHLL